MPRIKDVLPGRAIPMIPSSIINEENHFLQKKVENRDELRETRAEQRLKENQRLVIDLLPLRKLPNVKSLSTKRNNRRASPNTRRTETIRRLQRLETRPNSETALQGMRTGSSEEEVEVEQSLTQEQNNENLYVSNEQERESYLRIARNAMQVIKSWRTCIAEWKLEKGRNPVEGCVKSRQFVGHGQIFLLQAMLNIHPSILFDDLSYNTKEQPKWNKFVSTNKILEEIDNNYDVLYCIVPGRMCGLVQARDFVIVRYHTKEHGEYMHSACSVTHASMPEQRNMVRGENGPGGWIIESVPGEIDKCNFFWFVNTNVKVPLPKYILKTAISSVLMDYLKQLRQRINTLNQRSSARNTTPPCVPGTAN